MDNLRLFLFLGLSFVFLLMWDAWQQDFGTPTPPPSATATAPSVPQIPAVPVTPDVPTQTDVPAPEATAAGLTAPAAVPAELAPKASGQRVRVRSDVFELEFDTAGADLRQAKLLRYPQRADQLDKPYVLLSDKQQPFFVAQSGLLSPSGAPDHYATFSTPQTEYTLAEGADTLRVPFTWTSPEGIKVTKTYLLHRNSHVIELQLRVDNESSAPWTGRQYRQFQRSSHAAQGESSMIYTYTGGVIYSPEQKYEKIDFDDIKDSDLGREITGGWASMIQHYFIGAWIPTKDQPNFYYTKYPAEDRYVLGLVSPEVSVAAGQNATFSTQLYLGPKVQDVLEDLAQGLELTVDYGWLTVIAKPLFWLLSFIHDLVHNWGVAILLLTLLIKLAFYKLSEASYRSMAHMRRVQPKLVSIKERYGDDRQRMSQAMMELYKKEKINPFGGCLPILVQIPVFIALYWVLLESVELRQAPFMLWIKDLSTKDPYYILPLLMGVSMFVQQKLNPPPPDPVQAKVLMALPFIFTAFFAFFPAGLVLYWLANSVLSIAQQWYIMRRMDKLAATKGE